MSVPAKIIKNYTDRTPPEEIRFGNVFIDDFLLEESGMEIPINALRIIFNIIANLRNEQFMPEDRPKQLKLFEDEFENENNNYAMMKIKNSKISPSGTSKKVIEAYEFLVKYKMGWYKSENSAGKSIKVFGGLILSPSYDERGYTSFLISSYWLKKILAIENYNYILYSLVYNISANKHIYFAIWLNKLPKTGSTIKLCTLNKRLGLNYKNANSFCKLFLREVRKNLDKYSIISFNYKHNGEDITIIPYLTKTIPGASLSLESSEKYNINYRLYYLKKRFQISDEDMTRFSYQYRNIDRTRLLIEEAYTYLIKNARAKKIKVTEFKGKIFLEQLQSLIIDLYKKSKAAELFPDGYPVIL